MTSQPLLDFEALVAPIPGENPAGVKDLSAIRSQLDELRKEINPETFAKNDPRRPEAAKKADWKGIIELAQETLRSTSKDYLIATRLTEALVKDRGFAGLTAGLRLLRQMTELCWDRMHPEITEEDDIDTRARRFDWLDDVDRGAWFPSSLRLVPMMPPGAEGYGWQHWRDSQGGKSKITGPDIEKAIQISSRDACEDLVEDLSQSWQELELLSQVLNARMKTDTRNYAPGLMGIRGALVDCRTLAQQILQKKGGPKKGSRAGSRDKIRWRDRSGRFRRAENANPSRDLRQGRGGCRQAPADRASQPDPLPSQSRCGARLAPLSGIDEIADPQCGRAQAHEP